MPDVKLDCGNLACPGPLVRISKAMKLLKPGETLEVSAEDPAFCEDVKAWCRMTGCALLSLDVGNGRCRAVIAKTPESMR
jgi:TusA-related sulfurtransferase